MIDEADDKVFVSAFTCRLRLGEFLFSLYKNDLKTMAETLYKATKYMNAKDAMIALGDEPRKRQRQDDHRPNRGRKLSQTSERRDERRSKPLLRRTKIPPIECRAGSSSHTNKG